MVYVCCIDKDCIKLDYDEDEKKFIEIRRYKGEFKFR